MGLIVPVGQIGVAHSGRRRDGDEFNGKLEERRSEWAAPEFRLRNRQRRYGLSINNDKARGGTRTIYMDNKKSRPPLFGNGNTKHC